MQLASIINIMNNMLRTSTDSNWIIKHVSCNIPVEYHIIMGPLVKTVIIRSSLISKFRIMVPTIKRPVNIREPHERSECEQLLQELTCVNWALTKFLPQEDFSTWQKLRKQRLMTSLIPQCLDLDIQRGEEKNKSQSQNPCFIKRKKKRHCKTVIWTVK